MLERESRPTQSSSPRTSSSTSARQAAAPCYLSSRSADVILSDVRQTHIKSETLRSVNVLLDELLWLILGYARSFSTDRLRMGLLKVLPTSLGKDALLEAEVELRAYVERNPPMTPLPTDEATMQKFPLQSAFELLRLKCEAYSSLGDRTENVDMENTLHSRMVQVAGDATPKLTAVAPAALYLTAILEHICEHVLSNVGRVVARDSSRTTAHPPDLHVALCEDETIYSLFKTMKVYEQVEQQSKIPAPRRSKSISRNDIVHELPPEASDTPSLQRPRHSLDSTASNGSNNHSHSRTSVDKSRSRGLFKNASSRSLASENANSKSVDLGRHRRSNSLLGGDKKHSSVIVDEGSRAEAAGETSPADDDSMQDFDDLMRSGTTMKVSLTPDRLKTFEVFAKEKNLRANRPGNVPSSSPARDTPPPSSFPNGASQIVQKAKQQPSKARNRVESIAEDPVRERSSSIIAPVLPREEKPLVNPRARSFTDSRPPVAKPENLSLTRHSDTSDALSPSKRNMPVAVVDTNTGMPKRMHRGPVRRRESLDLDDVMDGSEDELPVAKLSLTPKSAQATTSGARDLMAFLSEGPPEPPQDPPHSPAPSAYDQRSNKGRFRSMVSRLTGSASSEKLSGRAGEEGLDSFRRSSTLGVNAGVAGPRPPQLTTKRSVPNVAAAARIPYSSTPASASHIQENPTSTPPPVPRIRHQSMSRKAVPPWDPLGSPKENEPSIPAKVSPRPTDSQKPLPDPTAFTPSAPPIDGNGTTSPVTKHFPREPEPPKSLPNQTAAADVQTPSPVTATPVANGHAKTDQEPKVVPPRPSRADRRAPALTLSIPADELIGDLRRLMARATTADECRVLMEMFFAKCRVPGDKRVIAGPMTPPVSPVRSELESRHESNLIEVLLGDGSTSPSPGSSPTTTPATVAVSEGPPVPTLTVDTQQQPVEPADRRSPQPRSSPSPQPRSSPSPQPRTGPSPQPRASPSPQPQPRSSPIITPAPSPVAGTA